MKKLLVLILFFSCAKAKEKEKAEPFARYSELKEMYAKKISEAKEKFDQETGWPSTKDCDGTLWAGIASAAGVNSVQLGQAEYEHGEVHRRPKSSGECYPAESASTISRDMVLGYIYGGWYRHDVASIGRFVDRAESKNWIIGEPWPERPGEVLLTGNLIGLLGRMTCELYGKCPVYRMIPPIHSKSPTDYVQHLTVLFILLDGEIDNKVGFDDAVRLDYPMEVTQSDIKKSEKEILEWHKNQKPNDALFNAAWHLYEDGNFSESAGLLLDKYEVPSYVRGHENYGLVHWLFSANLILKRF